MVDDQAWVTLATNDSYALGALVLAHSLKKVGTTRPLVIMITNEVTTAMRDLLRSVFDYVEMVNVLDSGDDINLSLMGRPDLGVTFTKLHCWRLTQFSKCVFLDSDTLVVQHCDELFEKEEFSAARDAGWPDYFNTGVFVFRPSLDTYTALLQLALSEGSFDGGDQGLLNKYFKSHLSDFSKHLPFVYNMVSSVSYTYIPAYKECADHVKIVHFLGGNKPWMHKHRCRGESKLTDIYLQQWWDLCEKDVLPHLSPEMSWLVDSFQVKLTHSSSCLTTVDQIDLTQETLTHCSSDFDRWDGPCYIPCEPSYFDFCLLPNQSSGLIPDHCLYPFPHVMNDFQPHSQLPFPADYVPGYLSGMGSLPHCSFRSVHQSLGKFVEDLLPYQHEGQGIASCPLRPIPLISHTSVEHQANSDDGDCSKSCIPVEWDGNPPVWFDCKMEPCFEEIQKKLDDIENGDSEIADVKFPINEKQTHVPFESRQRKKRKESSSSRVEWAAEPYKRELCETGVHALLDEQLQLSDEIMLLDHLLVVFSLLDEKINQLIQKYLTGNDAQCYQKCMELLNRFHIVCQIFAQLQTQATKLEELLRVHPTVEQSNLDFREAKSPSFSFCSTPAPSLLPEIELESGSGRVTLGTETELMTQLQFKSASMPCLFSSGHSLDAGLAASLASVNLVSEGDRYYAWESGQIDYMGKDNFNAILEKLNSTMLSNKVPKKSILKTSPKEGKELKIK